MAACRIIDCLQAKRGLPAGIPQLHLSIIDLETTMGLRLRSLSSRLGKVLISPHLQLVSRRIDEADIQSSSADTTLKGKRKMEDSRSHGSRLEQFDTFVR